MAGRKTVSFDSAKAAARTTAEAAKREEALRAKRRSTTPKTGSKVGTPTSRGGKRSSRTKDDRSNVTRPKKPAKLSTVGPVRKPPRKKNSSTRAEEVTQAAKRSVVAPKNPRNREYDKKLKSTTQRERKASASERVAQEKAAQRAHRQRKSRRKLYLRIAAVVLVLGLIGAGVYGVYQSSFLKVSTVTVSGNEHLTKEEIIDAAAVPSNATMLRVPLKSIAARVGELPWVKDVSVNRAWPTGVKIKVSEYAPAAAVSAGEAGESWLISPEGSWLEAGSAETTASLLAIQGPKDLSPKPGQIEKNRAVLNALEIAENLSPELRAQVVAIKTDGVEKTELLTAEGVSIYIGSADRLEEKDKIARTMLQEHAGNIIYINVRVPESPTWRGL